jgi:hypothetical protein
MPGVKNPHISSIFGFKCVTENYKRMIKVLYFISGLYSQIWLNLSRDDHHLVTNQNS